MKTFESWISLEEFYEAFNQSSWVLNKFRNISKSPDHVWISGLKSDTNSKRFSNYPSESCTSLEECKSVLNESESISTNVEKILEEVFIESSEVLMNFVRIMNNLGQVLENCRVLNKILSKS